MTNVKMSDIAREAGVSPSTVARAIYSSGYVAADKRKHILQVAERLGYIPNKLAQGLRSNSTQIIGNVLPPANDNPFFDRIQNAVATEAKKHNYQIINVVVERGSTDERKMLEELVGRMVDAVVFTAGMPNDIRNIEWLVKLNIPVVMIERPVMVQGIDKVLIDNFEGAYIATRHIITHGHRAIAYIGSALDEEIERSRLAGYHRALDEAGIARRPELEYVEEKLYLPQYGYQGAKKVLAQSNAATAIFAAGDLFACGVLQYAYEQNLRVPDDLSLVGFDDTLASFLAPPITSVSIPAESIGQTAIRLILERLHDKRTATQSVYFTPQMEDRGTVKHIK